MTEKNSAEDAIEETAKKLHLDLTTKNINVGLKLIALLTLVGGLSILGNIIADTVNTREIHPGFYSLRLVIGVLAIAVSYGIVEKESWSIWLYGVIVLIGFLLNPWAALLPAGILIYLYSKKESFKPFSVKIFFVEQYEKVKNTFT